MVPTHVYRLNRHTSVAQAAAIIKTAQADEQLWLLLTWGVSWGARLFDLRRLAHVARERGVDLRLVSMRSQVRMTAREAGIPPYIFLPLRLQQHVQRVTTQPHARQPMITTAVRLRRPRYLTLGSFLLALLATAVVLAAIAATLAIALPSAEIVLTPTTGHSAVTFTVSASPFRREIDYGKALLPARVVQVVFENNAQMATTGRADIPDGYASGQVVFANRSDREVVIPKRTLVRTGSGETARFYTVEEAVVPGQFNATRRVAVMAADPGPMANVRALTINVIEGELSTVLEVVNDSATGGGTMRQLPVVTPGDQNELLIKAKQEVGALALTQLEAELDEGEIIAPETFDSQIMSYKYDQVQGERSEIVSLTIKMVASATALQGQDLDLLATRFVEAQAEGEQVLVPGTLQVTRAAAQTAQGGEVTFEVAASGRVAPKIDPQLIRHELRGQELAPAEAWLTTQYDLATWPQITILPPQWKRLPVLPLRTQVQIQMGDQ